MSPQRTARPWQGMVERQPPVDIQPYDPHCYLCPGNERAGGVRNPAYEKTFVFDNDFAALLPEAPQVPLHQDRVLVAEGERGICRVICYSPRHDLALAEIDPPDIRELIDEWARQYNELGAIPWVQNVQIFENRGAIMGASNPHPHGQIWANEHLPNEAVKELSRQKAYTAENGRCLLCDYLSLELEEGSRLVCSNKTFLTLVPFWAIWPFEVLLMCKNHKSSLPDLDQEERQDLVDILQQLVRRYDRLFDAPFPYSMGFHLPPTDGQPHPYWHLHSHFYPPLLRSATIRKFMVGYEMLAQPQRDITPEAAAERLRNAV